MDDSEATTVAMLERRQDISSATMGLMFTGTVDRGLLHSFYQALLIDTACLTHSIEANHGVRITHTGFLGNLALAESFLSMQAFDSITAPPCYSSCARQSIPKQLSNHSVKLNDLGGLTRGSRSGARLAKIAVVLKLEQRSSSIRARSLARSSRVVVVIALTLDDWLCFLAILRRSQYDYYSVVVASFGTLASLARRCSSAISS